MLPHLRKLIDTRPPADPSTEGFLRKLEGPETADAYRKAMGDEGSSSTTDAQEPQLTTDELARLQAAEAVLRETQEKKDLARLKADYLAWAREFNLGGDDPQAWIANTFAFNPDGTVEVDDDLDLSNKSLTRLPPALIRVNGNLYLWGNELTSLKDLPQEIHGDLDLSNSELTSLYGLPQEIHGDLDISYNHLTSLDELKGKKIDGHLWLNAISAQCIPEGINLVGKVFMNANQTALKEDATKKGYTVREE